MPEYPPLSTADTARTGLVHSVETCGTVDGPGIRFILFTSGCSLRCLYCHNPDTSYKRIGTLRSVADILEEISRYRDFLIATGGGVTLSGGDPLYQPDFTKAILLGCKTMGLHTCIDTSGHLGEGVDADYLAATDMVLLDIKAWQPEVYRRLTGKDLAPTLAFAERLAAARIPIWLRYVLVPGITDNLDDIAALAAYAHGLGNVERVDILPFHQLGAFKWHELGIPYTLEGVEPPDAAHVQAAKEAFYQAGFDTLCVK